MRIIKAVLTAVAIVALTGLVIWQREQVRALMAEVGRLRAELAPVASLREEIDRLAKLRTTSEPAEAHMDLRELLRLRGEVGVLRRQASEWDKMKATIRDAERAADAQGVKWVTIEETLTDLQQKVNEAKHQEQLLLDTLKVPEDISKMEVDAALSMGDLEQYWPYFQARRARQEAEKFGSVLMGKLLADANSEGRAK
jgi:hypothetical protein